MPQHYYFSVLSIAFSAAMGLSLSASATGVIAIRQVETLDSPVYAQIRPPATPHLPGRRTEPEGESTANAGPICRDLVSFYEELVTGRGRSFTTTTGEYQNLLDRAKQYDYIEGEIRTLERRLNRAPSADRSAIRSDIQQLEQELAQLGDPRELRQLLAEERQQEREGFRGVHDARFSQWNEEAIAAFNSGNLVEAEQVLAAVKHHATELDLFDDRIAAESNLALLEEMQGSYVEALEQYRHILQQEESDGRPRQQVTTLINIARLHAKLGSYDRAIAYYDRSLTISQQQGYAQAANIALSSKGFLENQQRNYGQALTWLEQALAGVDANTLDPKAKVLHQDEIIRSGIGFAHLKLGQESQALTAYTQALKHSRTCENKRGEAIATNGLGDIKAVQGNREAALAHYQASLNIQTALGNRASVAENYVDIAKLFETEQPEVAIALYKKAVQILEEIRTNIEPLPPEQQQEYTESVTNVYRRLADLLAEHKRILESQQILDLLKFQELNDYLKDVREQRELFVGDSETEILKQFDGAMAQENPWSQINQNPVIRRASEQIRSDAFSQKINQALLEGLQGDIRRMDMNGAMLYPLIRPDHLKLILIPPYGAPVHVRVPVAETELLAEINAFRKTLEKDDTDPRPHAHQLYQWLIEPLEPTLTEYDTETLIYAPDGALRYVPLAALYDDNEEEPQWLIERFRINHITAASVTKVATSFQEPTMPSMLAAALSPEGNYPVTINGEALKPFSGLKHAQTEVNRIAQSIADTTILFGQDFSVPSVERNLAGQHIVHFATHGKFVKGSPQESFILFEQGKVNVSQIGDWPLSAANLVVFSACETALGGELDTGQEILGLGYQVQRAGARAAIASLWKVEDDSTSRLMDLFYKKRQQGATQVEALQFAQTRLLAEQSGALFPGSSHPYYWAPFILIGNGF